MSIDWVVRLSDQAQNDLTEIWLFIAEDNQAAADKMIDSLTDSMDRLKYNPRLGQAQPHLRAGSRSTIVRPYWILYSLSNPEIKEVRILRIIHGSRDVAMELSDSYPETFRTTENPTDIQ